MIIPELRAIAVDYQMLLIEWIAELRRRNLRVTQQPFALIRLTAWLRAFDDGTATLFEYHESTIEASNACLEAQQEVRADQRRRLSAIIVESGGAAWLVELEACHLDPLTEVACLLSANNGKWAA